MPEPVPEMSDPTPNGPVPNGSSTSDSGPGVPDRPEESRPHTDNRLVQALFHPGRGQVVVGLLLAVLGAAAVTQVRITGHNDDYGGMRQADLIQALQGLQAVSQRTERDIADLEATRNSLRDSNLKTATALEQAREEISSLGVLAGTLSAHGPGVRITVTMPPTSDLSVNLLLDGIEELRDAGAEAMEINDRVRVVADTSFESAPGGIDVDGRILKSPYTIDVIGPPESLNTALKFPGGFVDDLAVDEGKVSIKQSQDVEVSAIRTPVVPKYAQPTNPG